MEKRTNASREEVKMIKIGNIKNTVKYAHANKITEWNKLKITKQHLFLPKKRRRKKKERERKK